MENVNCGKCFECQKCIEAQDGSCPRCYECQQCITAQGGQQQRPGGPQRRGPGERCPRFGPGGPGGPGRRPGDCPQARMQGGQQMMITEARVKEIILDVLIAAGVVEDKKREGIELE